MILPEYIARMLPVFRSNFAQIITLALGGGAQCPAAPRVIAYV